MKRKTSMTDVPKSSGFPVLSTVEFLVLLLLPLLTFPRDALPLSHPLLNDASVTRTADAIMESAERPLQEPDRGDISENRRRSYDSRLAQTLPFQAPATPEIEPQVRTIKPTHGDRHKGEAPAAAQKDEKALAPPPKPHSQGDATQERSVAPESSAVKKKRAVVKPKPSSASETAVGKKASQPQGFQQPLSQAPLSGSADSSLSPPPLPPAMPYTPPAGVYGPAQRITPATRDAFSAPSRPSAGLAKPTPSQGGLPSATAVQPQGSLDNFVLDSFRGGVPPETVPPDQATEQKLPPSSLFGQLRQDMKQLGEGIKETFRGLLSLR